MSGEDVDVAVDPGGEWQKRLHSCVELQVLGGRDHLGFWSSGRRQWGRRRCSLCGSGKRNCVQLPQTKNPQLSRPPRRGKTPPPSYISVKVDRVRVVRKESPSSAGELEKEEKNSSSPSYVKENGRRLRVRRGRWRRARSVESFCRSPRGKERGRPRFPDRRREEKRSPLH